jgi:hypothetical protein
MPREALQDRREVGRGRSGVVYFELGEDRAPHAIKVFTGEGASAAVLWLLTGAPNPYIWNDNAVASAVYRRQVLATLVRYWFGDHLRLPRMYGWSWSARHRAFQLDVEFIDGHHAPLRHPEHSQNDTLIHELVQEVMKPLQRHLVEAGFDGLLWQAGLGNPVATNNFMIDTSDARPERTPRKKTSNVDARKTEPRHEGERPPILSDGVRDCPSGRRWVWIDLESGVPALFPFNPVRLLDYYLPKSWRHGRPLFDDVDIDRLGNYLRRHRARIEANLGARAVEETLAAFAQLERRQSAWKALGRLRRSITYAAKRGIISDKQAQRYLERPIRWYAKMSVAFVSSTLRDATKWLTRLGSSLSAIDWRAGGRTIWLFLCSQRFRTRLARRYVLRRIGSWERRRHLVAADCHRLRKELLHDESAEYVTDFGVHLAIKPIMKSAQWLFVPALMGTGAVDPFFGAALLAGGGAIARTAYTSGRAIQALRRRQEPPLVALALGLVPVLGNIAYPAQLAYAAEHTHTLARFIIYDALASIGRAVPVWGGPDTMTEHWFIHLFNATERLLVPRHYRISTT